MIVGWKYGNELKFEKLDPGAKMTALLQDTSL
jgi:hypothetical protein